MHFSDGVIDTTVVAYMTWTLIMLAYRRLDSACEICLVGARNH